MKRSRWILAGVGVLAVLAAACSGAGTGSLAREPVPATQLVHEPGAGPAPQATAGTGGGMGSVASVRLLRSTSDAGFEETLAAVEAAVGDAGLAVLTELDQAAGLSTVGLELEGTRALFVGNPEVGKDLFSVTPAAGAVLPLRLYVWADGGETFVGYLDPVATLTAVDLRLARAATGIAARAEQIVTQATGTPPRPALPGFG